MRYNSVRKMSIDEIKADIRKNKVLPTIRWNGSQEYAVIFKGQTLAQGFDSETEAERWIEDTFG